MATNRQKQPAGKLKKNQTDSAFEDVFGSSPVNNASSAIGATTNQRGMAAVMSRHLFEPRQPDGDKR